MNYVLFAKMDQVFSLKKNIKKIMVKWEKYWKSRGILSVRKSANHIICVDYVTMEIAIFASYDN